MMIAGIYVRRQNVLRVAGLVCHAGFHHAAKPSFAPRREVRRHPVVRLGASIAMLSFTACGCASPENARDPAGQSDSPLRLEASPSAGAKACLPGEYELRIAADRRVLMRVTPPATGRPRALLVALHGAGSGGAPGGLHAFRGAWKVPGLLLVAPAAAGSAWTLGATDVRFVERALQRAIARCRVDPRRVGIGGFSSGAGMALWLGLSNGDVFRSVIALSGGGSLPDRRVRKPRVFVAHGTLDDVIPIAAGGDAIVGSLREHGYAVVYRRFRGGHRVIPAVARRAVLSTVAR